MASKITSTDQSMVLAKNPEASINTAIAASNTDQKGSAKQEARKKKARKKKAHRQKTHKQKAHKQEKKVDVDPEIKYLKQCYEWGINPDPDGRPNHSITGWVVAGCAAQAIAEHYRDLNSNGDQPGAPSRTHVLINLAPTSDRDNSPLPYPYLAGDPPQSSSQAVVKAVHDGDVSYAFVRPCAETLPDLNVTPAMRFACHTFYSFLSQDIKERVNSLVNQSLPLKEPPEKSCNCGDQILKSEYGLDKGEIRIKRTSAMSKDGKTMEKLTVHSPHAVHLKIRMRNMLNGGDIVRGHLGVKYEVGICTSCGDTTGCHNPLIDAKLFLASHNYALWHIRMSRDNVCGLEIVRWWAWADWQRIQDDKDEARFTHAELCARANGRLPDGGISTLVLNAKPDQMTSEITEETAQMIKKYCAMYDKACDYTPGFCKACGEALGPMNPALDMKKFGGEDYWTFVVEGQKSTPSVCVKEMVDCQLVRNKRAIEYSAAPACGKPFVGDLRPAQCPANPINRYSFRVPFDIVDADNRLYKLIEGEPEWTKVPVKCIKIVMSFASYWVAIKGVDGMLAENPTANMKWGWTGLEKEDLKGRDCVSEKDGNHGAGGQNADSKCNHETAKRDSTTAIARVVRAVVAQDPLAAKPNNSDKVNVLLRTDINPNCSLEEFQKRLHAEVKTMLDQTGFSAQAATAVDGIPIEDVIEIQDGLKRRRAALADK